MLNTERAQMMCFACPVMSQCHEFAETTNARWGVWAGENRHRRGKGSDT